MDKKKIYKIAEEKACDYQRELGMIDSVSDDHVIARRLGFYDGFIDGAEWMKAKMMEGAVETDVLLTLHDKTGDISLHTGYLPKELGIKYGDKVKIIVVKEE